MRKNAKPHQKHHLPKSAYSLGCYVRIPGKLLMLMNSRRRREKVLHEMAIYCIPLVQRMYQERLRLSDALLQIEIQVIPHDRL